MKNVLNLLFWKTSDPLGRYYSGAGSTSFVLSSWREREMRLSVSNPISPERMGAEVIPTNPHSRPHGRDGRWPILHSHRVNGKVILLTDSGRGLILSLHQTHMEKSRRAQKVSSPSVGHSSPRMSLLPLLCSSDTGGRRRVLPANGLESTRKTPWLGSKT